ncbi:Rbm17 [Symbiodinium pilosum]|uniref:Rbm17 protein n=1 Tax=Symbiodinium pilosum TaxID=2952 RepID=A0A812WCQ6_SYMPI|nr:Rbm17 [Symbiodinium pilosum]
MAFEVKAGILKRLQAGGNGVQRAASAPPPVPPPAPPPAPPPPPEPEPEVKSCVEGVELFGDVCWFADLELRGRLLEEVKQAHAAEKILVALPSEEIPRILTKKGGQVLGAGAVLRLGGVHHGGYGESDINYAYRQLSRALHPDKNPGIEEAHDAFKRLGEAAEDPPSYASQRFAQEVVPDGDLIANARPPRRLWSRRECMLAGTAYAAAIWARTGARALAPTGAQKESEASLCGTQQTSQTPPPYPPT